MSPTDTIVSTGTKLRALADLIDNHPDLPVPYITGYSSGDMQASWYLHVHGIDLPNQKTTAARIVRTLGGQWDKTQDDDQFSFTQDRDGLSLTVIVNRAAVCERVVTGTHEVTVPATPAQPAQEALPERTERVEDIQWVCSSLLADEQATA